MIDSNVAESIDRRASTRVPFAGDCAIAEFDGESLPEPSSFRRVQAFDLSHTGISFSSMRWPVSNQLVISLGDAQKPARVTAQIVRCYTTTEDDANTFEVHCEFAEWID